MKYLLFIAFMLITEIVLAFLFSVISQLVYKRLGLDFRSIFKGLIERVFLFIALLNGYPHALTFFSALKLATRLKHSDSNENAFNDFYLIGNLISVSVAFGYVVLFNKIII
jgi:hypothetical protein